MIKDSGERTEFETGAVRDMHGGKGRMDLLPWRAIMAVSRHCEEGAEKYGEHNVDRGIPVHSLFDSGIRHAAKWWLGIEDEPHLTAACWNMLWALEMTLSKPEMDDRPRAEAPAVTQTAKAPEAEKAPVEKKPAKAQGARKPGQFSGYGARYKREVYQKLLKLREDGVTIQELAKMSGCSQTVIMQMLNAEKVNYGKWEAMGMALAAAEEAGEGNEA